MDAFLLDWLNLLLRWFHLIVGIGWIGASFYFVWLDFSFRPREQMRPGVAGTSWMVHGGGFYQVEKYLVAPPELPADLHWFKWEAYLTFLSGFALLGVQYYWNAGAFLIDPTIMPLVPWQAIVISVVSLALGWLAYDALCRSPLGENTAMLALAVFGLVVLFAFLFTHVFSGRGAFIHVGAMVGSIMAANVFAVIIPNQRKITAALMSGATPDPSYGKIGKQRSLHNTYLTLPVLLLMVSNHYPFLYSRPNSWLVVALIVIAGGTIRFFLVRTEAGENWRKVAWALPTAAVALLATIVWTSPRTTAVVEGQVADAEAVRIVQTHCISCHAGKPTHESFAGGEPPKGVILETQEGLLRHAAQVIAQSVQGHAMPLGNETGMTDIERARLGAWLAAKQAGQ
jgi:uncharacterized membrane protein